MADKNLRNKLADEFACAINAVFGDLADKPFEEVEVTNDDLIAIAKKVAFYIGID